MLYRSLVLVCAVVAVDFAPTMANAALKVDVQQITHGDQHHFFGYIGQCQTIPWNASGRYILSLRSSFHDHLPRPEEHADIVLIDTQNDYRVIPIEKTRAWNLQQGTMLYWNPKAAETQFFFNDRDPKTNKIFTVVYDIESRLRVREYRFDDVSIANGGVDQKGEFFIAINYGRMARLRPVTGYPAAFDWTVGQNAPADDGVFRVDVASGKKTLLVSFKQLAERLRSQHENIDDMGLYINHTLCNRLGDRVFFFARGRLGDKAIYANTPITMKPDGSALTLQQFIGGHPEWGEGHFMIGAQGDRQVLYDTKGRTVTGFLGDRDVFPKPGGDISLSADAQWFVNGYSRGGDNLYSILHLASGDSVQTNAFSRGPYQRGELRIDPAPRWNRANNRVLVPGFTEAGTRQLFLVTVKQSK